VAWNIRTSRQISPDLEILVNAVNVDVAPSIVLDAGGFPLNAAGEREIKAGTPLKKVGNQYVPWVGGTDAGALIMGILVSTIKVPDTLTHSDVPAAMWNHGQWFRADRIIGWATYAAAIRAALPTCKFS
jgi:hypothetical protein